MTVLLILMTLINLLLAKSRNEIRIVLQEMQKNGHLKSLCTLYK